MCIYVCVCVCVSGDRLWVASYRTDLSCSRFERICRLIPDTELLSLSLSLLLCVCVCVCVCAFVLVPNLIESKCNMNSYLLRFKCYAQAQ